MQELDPYHPTFSVCCRPEELATHKDTHDVFMCGAYSAICRTMAFPRHFLSLDKLTPVTMVSAAQSLTPYAVGRS